MGLTHACVSVRMWLYTQTLITSTRLQKLKIVHIYITGHSEYDSHTLQQEYDRDLNKGLPIDPPENYFPENNPVEPPFVRWRGHAHLLFSNWLNYYVYQRTPYDLEQIPRSVE